MESVIYLQDCIEGMKQFPDKYFDLCVSDPPYGIGASDYKRGGTQYGKSKTKCKTCTPKDWDSSAPDVEFFKEVIRVSKNQIFWGANHYISKIPIDSSCWLVWDKDNGEGSGYADCELALTSFKTAVRRLKYRWAGMLQQNMKDKEDRIHPTQKPAALYDWIFSNYATKGQKILDTHGGSMSSVISALKNEMEITCFEIDKEYFDLAKKRIENHFNQTNLFLEKPKIKFIELP